MESFGRGSSSGQNGHALWLCCKVCKLRIMYTPRWGATGSYRSAGPLAQDVEDKLKKKDPNDIHPSELKTKTLGLEAAEQSAMKQLEHIQKQKATLAAKAKAKPQASPPVQSTKKTVKREHQVPAETHEDWAKVETPVENVVNLDG